MQSLNNQPFVMVRQRKELAEIFGFESRNKYEILDSNGQLLYYCAEMQKGLLGFLARQLLGHWRSFDINFYDAQRNLAWRAEHPFRFIFQQLDIFGTTGILVGNSKWRWGFFKKRYTLENRPERKTFDISSGFFSFWSFPVYRNQIKVGSIDKKWSGLLTELFTDADTFKVEFSDSLTEIDRGIILSAAILVDLTYFEEKASGVDFSTD
jgi:uncharacterized protein YxjI